MCEEGRKKKDEGRLMADRLLEMGLGLAAYSEEKLSSFVKEISARGEARQEDIARFRDNIREKGADFRREFSARIEKEVRAALKKMNLATADEVEELKRRLAEMEKKSDA